MWISSEGFLYHFNKVLEKSVLPGAMFLWLVCLDRGPSWGQKMSLSHTEKSSSLMVRKHVESKRSFSGFGQEEVYLQF